VSSPTDPILTSNYAFEAITLPDGSSAFRLTLAGAEVSKIASSASLGEIPTREYHFAILVEQARTLAEKLSEGVRAYDEGKRKSGGNGSR
jgi:hypothetical protein